MITLDDLRQIEDSRALFDSAAGAIDSFRAAMDEAGKIRARALAALAAEGYTHRDLADTLKLSQPRVSQLLAATEKPVMEVLRAWVSLERHLAQVADSEPGTGGGSVYMRAVRTLRASGRFDSEVLEEIDDFRKLRNRVVHGQLDVTVETAESVLDLTRVANARLVLWIDHQEIDLADPDAVHESNIPRILRASIDGDRRHGELKPNVAISFYREPNPRTGIVQAWVQLTSQTDRAYVVRIRGYWTPDAYTELGVRQLDPFGETSVFLTNSPENLPSYLRVAYEAAGWQCPCDRPAEMHWTENRKVELEPIKSRAILRMRFHRVGRGERLVVQNLGTAAATNVVVSLRPVGVGDAPYISGDTIGRLLPQSDFSFVTARTMGTASQVEATFDWREDDQSFTETQTVSLV